MSPPLEGPTSSRKKTNPTTVILAIIGVLGVSCCIGLGVLAAVLAPVFRNARETVRTQICAGNLRRVGSSIAMYAAEHDDHLPLAANWMDAVQPLVGNRRTMQCPDVRNADRSAYGYAFNVALSGKKASALDPTSPVVFDSSNLGRNASSGVDSLPVPGRHRAGTANVDNLILLDGSLQAKVK